LDPHSECARRGCHGCVSRALRLVSLWNTADTAVAHNLRDEGCYGTADTAVAR